jgi:membrane glycosyltransferase
VILVLSLVLGLVPLAGVVWIFVSGMITLSPPSATVDGLFMTLILLTVSFCFLLNAFWEARDQGLLAFMQKKKRALAASPATSAAKTASTPAAASPAPKVPTAKVSS